MAQERKLWDGFSFAVESARLAVMLYIVLILLFLGLIFLPQWWVKGVISHHSRHRDDFPGTGGELARHLLDEAGLKNVKVEPVKAGDHYDPTDKMVRLEQANYDGRSISAVAIAAHEVGHAIQDARGYGPLKLRTRMAGLVNKIERFGSVFLLATPVIALLTRTPSIIVLEVAAGILMMSASVVFHLVTLPVEFDASFGRALPILKSGKYLQNKDLPAASHVLKAAAFTYVAAGLVSILNISRWLRILR